MRRQAVTPRLLDKLHKGFVVTCVGLTCYGLFLLGLRAERYFTVIRPQQQLRELELKNQLLAEGREMAHDQAPELKL